MRIGLVFAGGGARGAYQAGVAKQIAAMGVPIAAVSGSGVGAVNAALLSSEASFTSGAHRLETAWRTLAESDQAKFKAIRFGPKVPLGLYATLLLILGQRTTLDQFVDRVIHGARQANRQRLALVRPTGADAANFDPIEFFLDVVLDPDIIIDETVEARVKADIDLQLLNADLPVYASVQMSPGGLTGALQSFRAALNLSKGARPQFVNLNHLSLDERMAVLLGSSATPLLFESQSFRGASISGGFSELWRREGLVPWRPLVENESCDTLIVVHLADGSLWDKDQVKPATTLEIRPQTMISRNGVLSDYLGLDATAIDAWFEQGIADAAKILGQLESLIGARSKAEAARKMRDAALDDLQDLD